MKMKIIENVSMPALVCPKCGCKSVIQTMVSLRRVYYACNNPDCNFKWAYRFTKYLSWQNEMIKKSAKLQKIFNET